MVETYILTKFWDHVTIRSFIIEHYLHELRKACVTLTGDLLT